MEALRKAAMNAGGGCFCYIVRCADGSFYTGWTKDPERRVKAHNAGTGARYTRARRPVQLVLLEPAADAASAMKRERAIKAMTRPKKLSLIAESPGIQPGRAGANGLGRRVRGGRRISL